MLGARQLDQVARADLAAREAVLGRLADQLPRRIERPGVEWASEPRLVAAERLDFLDQPRAAMGAHVEKGARGPVLAAHDQYRRPGSIEDEKVARLRDVARQAGDDRLAEEQMPPLGLEPLGID